MSMYVWHVVYPFVSFTGVKHPLKYAYLISIAEQCFKWFELIVWVGQAFLRWSPPSRHEPYVRMARTLFPSFSVFFGVFEPSKF